ncbi:MAG: NADH-quinone oxidoreductase subunit J [Phycisphaerales bacterium]|nr:NADH-quinone oxidoreductase subunit J [Phycisphaerales bacterium]
MASRFRGGHCPLNPSMPLLQPTIAIAAAALGLLLVLMGRGAPQRWVGGAISLGALAWLLVLAGEMPDDTSAGALGREAAFIVFAALSLASAVRMIAQPRPVYAALFFVLVILSTCGLLLLLEAWFIAFAVVIVYAGAILITYMFVLMLAQQASDAQQVGEIPEYDRRPREPMTAVIVGMFVALIMAVVVFRGIGELPAPATEQTRLQASAQLLNALPRQLDRAATNAGLEPSDDLVARVQGGDVVAQSSAGLRVLDERDFPGTTELVGWDLVARFPASLEVAGVVLLMAMFGAVVLARRRIDLGEDELRASSGMPSLGGHGESGDAH